MRGDLALVGSGEFLPAMRDTDARLLEGRTRRVAVVPTAAGTEGDGVVRRWFALADAHYEALGATVRRVDVRTREDALAWSDDLTDVGLVYLSGGRPGHLVSVLEGTPLLTAILSAWAAGAAIAGCSAGAMALAAHVVASPWRGARTWSAGVGVVPDVGVLPHFDRFNRRPGSRVLRAAVRRPDGGQVVGIDEDTAVVHRDGRWSREGVGQVWSVDGTGIEELDLNGLPAPVVPES